jgi:hypothetical protein
MNANLRKTNQRTNEAYRDFGDELKHAARSLLWLPEAKRLRQEKGRFLKYFTLPGKRALDIFFFEQEGIIEKQVRGFPGVRFCENDFYSFAAAKKCLGDTVGIKRNFEDIVLKNRPEFWDGFPYDIYNLDFCGTCFPDNQPPFSDTFEALTKIINRHHLREHFPFLIFMTMKAFSPGTLQEAKDQLAQNIEDNRDDNNFTEIINRIIPSTDSFVRDNFVDFIILSIPKLVCHIAHRERKHILVKHRAKYRRYNSHDGVFYITKFVFRFDGCISGLSIGNQQYIANVKDIMNMDDVLTIKNSIITTEIRASHNRLLNYSKRIDKETAKY